MTNTLHEAIAAVRAGDMKGAQLIAANIVRDNPEDPNGWYLLSQLVDSDARRAAYLGKTLALDPTHARARIEFDALPPALAADLAPAGLVELPETGPDGLVEEAPTATWDHAPDTAAAAVPAATLEAEAPVAIAGGEAAGGAAVPEWLQPLGPKPVPPSAHLTPPTPLPGQPRPKPAAARKAAPARKKKKNSGNQALAILLGLLALLTVLVLAVLVYLLLF